MQRSVNSGIGWADIQCMSEITERAGEQAGARLMRALGNDVPLTLLLDISSVDCPNSVEIAESEGGIADWLPEH